MIRSFEPRGISPGRGWRHLLTGLIVVVAALALAPAAFADGWSLQSVPTPSGTISSQLFGVSCPATNDCYAVGQDDQSSGQVALIEHWNGSSWSVYDLGGPGSASGLDSVSCPTTSFCEAVGSYSTSGAIQVPLAYTWGTGGFAQQPVAVPAGDDDDYLTSVSCQSSSFCLAVGVDNSTATTQPLVEKWTGSAFGRLPGGDNSGTALLNAVSCAAAQSFYCLGVGGERTADGVARPYVVQFDDGGLESISNTSDGRFVVQPSGTADAVLTGVSCLDASTCRVIGNYYGTTAQTEINPWAAVTTSSGWSLQSVPPSDANVGFAGDSVDCPSECWAVGNYVFSNGLFADTLVGSTWEFATLPAPTGTEPELNGVSCAQVNYCESVGFYTTSAGKFEAFAEQYTYTIPSSGSGGRKCVSLNCPPPPPVTPHHFALAARGLEQHGATVTATLKKPKTLVLLVHGVRHHHPVIVGLVALGRHPAGTSEIHWNLRVDGKLLRAGTYQISLHSISIDVLSPATPPGQITLTVNANGHVRTR